jgi:hypothetical protein
MLNSNDLAVSLEPPLSAASRASLKLRAVLVLIGFTATVAQIVLLRELMVVSYGNEISLGVMLASWLLWTALGSSVLGRLSARASDPKKLMATLQVLLGGFVACNRLRGARYPRPVSRVSGRTSRTCPDLSRLPAHVELFLRRFWLGICCRQPVPCTRVRLLNFGRG